MTLRTLSASRNQNPPRAARLLLLLSLLVVVVSHYRYIDVYVRRGGVWRVVSVQTTSIPEPVAK